MKRRKKRELKCFHCANSNRERATSQKTQQEQEQQKQQAAVENFAQGNPPTSSTSPLLSGPTAALGVLGVQVLQRACLASEAVHLKCANMLQLRTT